MNEEEIKEFLGELKNALKKQNPGKNEDEIDEIILDGFFKSYLEGKLDKDDLGVFAAVLGYELKDEVFDEIENEMKEGDR